MTGYYDIVLGLIPLSLAGISGALTVAGVELTLAVTVAALIAVLFMGHALFIRAPVPTDQSSTHTDVTPVNAD